MAVILKNSTCSLCCKVVGEDVIAFPRMIENPADELLFADDAAFHRSCLERHPLYDRLIYRVKLWEEALNANLSSRHECFICKKNIVHPDDCYNFGFLTYDQLSPLWYLNYRECHESCLCPGAIADDIANLLNDLVGNPHVSQMKLADLLKQFHIVSSIRLKEPKP